MDKSEIYCKEPWCGRIRVAYLLSMKFGMLSFTYREIKELIASGLEVTLFPTKYYTGPYMPDNGMKTYIYKPAMTMLKQPLFLSLKPIIYLRLLLEAIKSGSVIDLLVAKDFSYQMRKRKIDRIHSEFGDHKLFIGYYCKKILKIPLSVRIHAHEIYVNPNWKMFQKALGACDTIFTVSELNKKILMNKFEVPEEKIVVNRLFIDITNWKYKDPIKILIVAAFEKRKGHIILFKAMKKLNRNNIEVWVIGGGERIPSDERVDPQSLAKELGVKDRVIFFGKVLEEVLKTLYNLCDIFILPSMISDKGQKEGIPVSLIEAMAYGKPVISTRHAGIPELVEEILVKENDVDELAKAIELLADNRDLRRKLGERNRKIIEERYSKKNVLKLRDVFLDKCLDGKEI